MLRDKAERIVDLYKRGYYSRMTAIHGLCELSDDSETARRMLSDLVEPLVAEEVRERVVRKLAGTDNQGTTLG